MFQKMMMMMKDENFRAFISHPKVREMFQDPEMKKSLEAQKFSDLLSNPKFAEMMRDPEVMALMSKLDLKKMSE